MSKKVFVTGGAGYIGSHTCVELLKSNYDVMVFDNLSNGSYEAVERVKLLSNKDIHFVKGDICNSEQIGEAIVRFQPDTVLHFAGLKAVGESVKNPLDYYNVNVVGSLNVLSQMSRANCNEIVFSSSASVYSSFVDPPFKETDQVEPISPYGKTKLIFEQLLNDWCQSDFSNKAVCLRYFNPIGAHHSGMIGENPNGTPNNIMPYISQVAIGLRSELAIFGNDYPTRDGTGERDYIHIIDLAEGHMKAVEKISSLQSFKIFNLGTGNGTTVLELLSAFENASGKSISSKIVGRRQGDAAKSFADPSLSNDVLGISSNRTIDEMCQDTWKWQTLNPNGYDI